MKRLTRDGTAESVSRDQIIRRERGGDIHFPCSADHEQDWQPDVGPGHAQCFSGRELSCSKQGYKH